MRQSINWIWNSTLGYPLGYTPSKGSEYIAIWRLILRFSLVFTTCYKTAKFILFQRSSFFFQIINLKISILLLLSDMWCKSTFRITSTCHQLFFGKLSMSVYYYSWCKLSTMFFILDIVIWSRIKPELFDLVSSQFVICQLQRSLKGSTLVTCAPLWVRHIWQHTMSGWAPRQCGQQWSGWKYHNILEFELTWPHSSRSNRSSTLPDEQSLFR